jgi:Domain of unknown function (DUF4328)
MSWSTNAPTGWQRENQYPAAERRPLGPGHGELGRALTALLVSCGVVSLAKAMQDLYGIALFSGGTVDPSAIVANNWARIVLVNLALLTIRGLLVLATGIATMAWLYQAYGSREADPGLLPHERWWTIGGWLIPGICLVRPLQLMRNLYLATAGRPGLRVRCPSYFTWWWACFLIGNVLTSPLTAPRQHSSSSERQIAIGLDLVGQLLLVAASWVFVIVLGSITSQMGRWSSESTATATNTRVR